MFANRYTCVVDACSLVGALKRNILLSLAEAEFYRLRWSDEILSETERAIKQILINKSMKPKTAKEKAYTAVENMKLAFPEANILGYEIYMKDAPILPDTKDDHVLAAAVHTRASMIVTENIKDFPSSILSQYHIEAKTADEFIADTIELDEGRAIATISQMRKRFKKPNMTSEQLLLKMEGQGLTSTVTTLKPFTASL